MMTHSVRMLALTASLALALPATAQELTGVLKRIKDSGEMTIGHRDASVPFS
jgi:glutamate/aspartate transport system substrate-binding protein